jgi:uncharacterized membrane protein
VASSSSELNWSKLVRYVGSSLWFVPVLTVLAGSALSFGTLALDRHFGYEAIPRDLVGGPDAASAILSAIATSMVSLAALVLTITMVVVQLAMGQFSPRIVQRILQDKPSQLAIGLFIATFVHAILALREVTIDGDGGGQVPGIAVVTAFVLVLVSVAVLVMYVHHIGKSLRVSSLIELVGKDTRKLLDRVYSDKGASLGEEAGSVRVVRARRSGVITKVGHAELVEEARRIDGVLELVPALGQFIAADAPLFRVRDTSGAPDPDRIHDALILSPERTLDEDVGYGIRLLVDIAQRSMADSPLQDPTTAIQAIDRIHEILRQLARRPFPDGRHRDEAGTVRLIVPAMTWDAYVHLAFDEIRLVGAGSPQVARRLVAALDDLKSVALPERIAVLDDELDLLTEAVRTALEDERDVEIALTADFEGIGVAAATTASGAQRPPKLRVSRPPS